MSVVAILVRYARGVAMLSVSVFDHTNLPAIQKKIKEAAETGVNAAVQEGVEWVKGIIRDGSQVGHQYFPDVTPATKRAKAKKGQTIVLKDTGNTLASFDGEAKGLEGKITGGGEDYHARLFKRWQIDKLYMQVHAKESKKIIEKAIEKAL